MGIKEIFDNIWNGPARYVAIFIAAVLIFYVPFMILYMKKKRGEAKTFRAENPDAVTVYIKGVLQGQLVVMSINDTPPKSTFDSARQGFFLVPGENIIEAQYSWTRPGVLYKTVTKTVGPTKIKVTAEAGGRYYLSYDKKAEEYIFEEMK